MIPFKLGRFHLTRDDSTSLSLKSYFYFCMNSLSGAVMVCLVVLKLFVNCGNLFSNSLLAVGKIGLNIHAQNSHFMIRQL